MARPMPPPAGVKQPAWSVPCPMCGVAAPALCRSVGSGRVIFRGHHGRYAAQREADQREAGRAAAPQHEEAFDGR